jgi:dihydrofolate reductase
MKINIIAAMAKNRVIGKDNAIPWSLPEDLRRFKELTMNKIVVMGRKTFESIGKDLPGRRIVVLSKNKNFSAPNAEVFYDIKELLEYFKNEPEIFIAGGGEVYKQFLPKADFIYLTLIDKNFDGDTRFPKFDFNDYKISKKETKQTADFSYTFFDMKKASWKDKLLNKLNDWKNFIHKKQMWQSRFNQRLKVECFFGNYTITVNGYIESGDYMNGVQWKMLKKIPKNHRVKKLLMLGLGAGGFVKRIKKRFPDCEITCVEHDPTMIEIALNTFLSKGYQPKIVQGEANAVVNDLNDRYDVIIYDLYTGGKMCDAVCENKFIENLKRLLAKDGWLQINFFEEKNRYAPILDKHFSRWHDLRYSYNRMAVYRNFGQGKVGDPLPTGYKDKMMSLDYIKTSIYLPKNSKIEITDKESVISYKLGPVLFEKHIGDVDPVVKPHRGWRHLEWQRLARVKKLPKWRPLAPGANRQQTGVAVLNGDAKYYEKWTKHAQRHRLKWLAETRYKIEDISFDEFKKSYNNSHFLDPFSRHIYNRTLEFCVKSSPRLVHLWGVRDIATNEILASLGIVDFPDISMSTHNIAFINKKVRKTSVGTGLIEHWYQHCLKNNIKFLSFGVVRRPTDPRSWKGFSQFKQQFDLYLINYPKPLIKITRH